MGPKPTRRPMSVSWLRPLKSLAKADYVQLCQWALHVEGATQQRVYFHGSGTRGGPSRGSMAHHAMGAKRCYAVQNALQWLSIRGTPSAYTWDQFLEHDVSTLADSCTLSFFAGQVSNTFV